MKPFVVTVILLAVLAVVVILFIKTQKGNSSLDEITKKVKGSIRRINPSKDSSGKTIDKADTYVPPKKTDEQKDTPKPTPANTKPVQNIQVPSKTRVAVELNVEFGTYDEQAPRINSDKFFNKINFFKKQGVSKVYNASVDEGAVVVVGRDNGRPAGLCEGTEYEQEFNVLGSEDSYLSARHLFIGKDANGYFILINKNNSNPTTIFEKFDYNDQIHEFIPVEHEIINNTIECSEEELKQGLTLRVENDFIRISSVTNFEDKPMVEPKTTDHKNVLILGDNASTKKRAFTRNMYQ